MSAAAPVVGSYEGNQVSSSRRTLRQQIEAAISASAVLLPEQAPLHAFVHHNTLHAFEYLRFDDALLASAKLFGAEPYPSESRLIESLTHGDISEAVLGRAVDSEPRRPLCKEHIGHLSYPEFVKERLRHLVPPQTRAAYQWRKEEGRLFHRFSRGASPARVASLTALAEDLGSLEKRPAEKLLRQLWESLAAVTPPEPEPESLVGQAPGARTWAYPPLIRLAAAYLDQGVASVVIPGREHGFYQCFRELYSLPLTEFGPTVCGLRQELLRQGAGNFDALDACAWALEKQSVHPERYSKHLRHLLLPVRGWAGMFLQLERHPEKAPFVLVPARLADFVAVALVLQTFAMEAKEAEAHWFPEGAQPAELLSQFGGDGLTYEAYDLAQRIGLDLRDLLAPEGAANWIQWVASVPELTRRRLLHRALEETHLQQLVRGFADHARLVRPTPYEAPAYQAIFCIDDREESFRRHLEEVSPQCETYAYPGFFGVAMLYRAANEYRARGLCPVVTTPTHRVSERGPVLRTPRRARLFRPDEGSSTHGIFSSVFGIFSLIPLVLGVLFPRRFHLTARPPLIHGQLDFERRQSTGVAGDGPDSHLPHGYTPVEMANVVEKMLREIGLIDGFSPLVLTIGHGSSSLNNPHLAAYGCGATAGGCGGPNARVVAAMANHEEVRQLLAARGIAIPASTAFVGGNHDTCTDNVDFDVAVELSAGARAAWEQAKSSFRTAAQHNARERCRLFGTVARDISPSRAKAFVEARSVDLSEPRPEYNHAKNSCAVVGRRRFTRGLFLDQRAFLVSHTPEDDPEGRRLESILLGSVPVGMGINLEYFFGAIDQKLHGAGSKLPHNVTGLLGVMDGHMSDLRTGLYQQMIELHPPVRLAVFIDASPEVLKCILARNARIAQLANNEWFQLMSWEPEADRLHRYQAGEFIVQTPAVGTTPRFESSLQACGTHARPVRPAHIARGMGDVQR